jgi:hypothetical protein
VFSIVPITGLVSGPPGAPADPDTGALMKVDGDGSLTTIIDGLDRSTLVEFIGNTAYVIIVTGDILKINGRFGFDLLVMALRR